MSLFDKLQSNRKAKIDEEKNAGAAFLAENKKKEGVFELPNGIQYQIIKEGSGDKPDVRDKIKAH
jgi:FKBP-type peptidyl-prolyl cis-trans isomerase FklB